MQTNLKKNFTTPFGEFRRVNTFVDKLMISAMNPDCRYSSTKRDVERPKGASITYFVNESLYWEIFHHQLQTKNPCSKRTRVIIITNLQINQSNICNYRCSDYYIAVLVLDHDFYCHTSATDHQTSDYKCRC